MSAVAYWVDIKMVHKMLELIRVYWRVFSPPAFGKQFQFI